MTAATEPQARRAGGLTDKGLIVASCIRIKNTVEHLSEAEQAALAVELRNIVSRVCVPFLHPVA